MPSLTVQVYAQFLLLFLSFTLFFMTSNVDNCNRRDLLMVSPMTLHISLGRFMFMALTALLGSVQFPVILMSWAILFLPVHGRWVLHSLCSFSFWHSSLSISVTNPSFFELQPTLQEHEELAWLAGNLKLKVTNYSRHLYDPEGAAHPGGGDDDDDDGGDKEDLEATPSYQPRKRRHHWLPAVETYIGIQQSFFFFSFLLLWFFFSFISLSKHLDLVWGKGLYLRTSFYIYASNWDLALNLQDIWLIVCFHMTLLIGCLEYVLDDP